MLRASGPWGEAFPGAILVRFLAVFHDKDKIECRITQILISSSRFQKCFLRHLDFQVAGPISIVRYFTAVIPEWVIPRVGLFWKMEIFI